MYRLYTSATLYDNLHFTFLLFMEERENVNGMIMMLTCKLVNPKDSGW